MTFLTELQQDNIVNHTDKETTPFTLVKPNADHPSISGSGAQVGTRLHHWASGSLVDTSATP